MLQRRVREREREGVPELLRECDGRESVGEEAVWVRDAVRLHVRVGLGVQRVAVVGVGDRERDAEGVSVCTADREAVWDDVPAEDREWEGLALFEGMVGVREALRVALGEGV